jgi:hypothetical protein
LLELIKGRKGDKTDMANRIFDLPECRGSFQVKGIVSGVEKDRFYTDKKTKTGKDFRAVNFGCEYNDKQTVYMSLNGMPQQKVYFSKRNQNGKTETKDVPWANRNKFNEEGFRMIGVGLGLVKTTDKDGKTVNDKKTMAPFDACEYINANLKDDMSTFIRGNIEFSSYTDGEGNVRRSVKYVPNQISLCKEVDFSEYDGVDNKPVHDFTQTIVYTGIEKERENDKDTGRFVVAAKIVTYSDIVDTELIITDAKLAGMFKKNLKPYTAISVHGRIEVTHSVQEADEDDCWGEANSMNSVSAPTKTEMIITGASPATIDRETYTEKNVAEAVKKIKASKTAEQNFSGKANSNDDTDDWGETDSDMDEEPW